jgi:polysaccharide deacetylase 2 family uncharacterized protein YibQ
MRIASRPARHGAIRPRSALAVLAAVTHLAGAAVNPPAGAEPIARSGAAYLSIIIDDLGNSLREGRRVVSLPAPIACAILPHTPHAELLAREAHTVGKEVLLHLPMESLTDEPPGPGVLEAVMPAREFLYTLAYDLTTVPHAVGINNHMGSRLTQEPAAMRLLMQALRNRGDLFFVDSRTSPRSVAASMAAEHGVPVLARNVFLDNEPSDGAIRARLRETLAIARRHGAAIAIGHPHSRTLSVLEQWLPTLAGTNATIVPLSELLRRQREPNHADATRAGM